MSPYEAYCMYIAIKLHFKQSSYDFFKYNKKSYVTVTAFKKRRDKYYFEKVSGIMNEEKFIQKMLVQIDVNGDFWIKDILTSENEKNRKTLLKKLESFSYCFREEMIAVREMGYDLNVLIKKGDEHYPIFFMLECQKKLSNTSIISLDCLFNFLPSYNKIYEDDVLWNGKLLLKYKPFIIKYIDNKKIIKILQEIFV